ncbi:MAG: Fpg/Nei family DNA glycosylase [Microthrixaceae bacterium]
MPELPELELLRRDLERDLAGRKIKAVEVPVAGVVKYPTKKALIAALPGTKISEVRRRGTLITLGVEGTHQLVLSLGERTRVRRMQAKEATATGTALVVTFTQGGQLRLVDPKKQATVEYVTEEELTERHPELAQLGLDAADEPISWTTFGENLLRRDGKLKSVLMDPGFLVGIGPIYSDEILFEAGLRYDRRTVGLSAQEIRRLYRAVVEIVHEAIKYGGTSLGDDGWVGPSGAPGEYQDHLAVYKRDGEMSPRARGPIVKTRFGSGYTYYCEQTQV